MDRTIILIDGSSFVFRAFHAMPELTSPTGEPTGATYGIINMLKQLQKKYPTSYWGCVFDVPGITFREVLYPQYKATRRETPKDLIAQINTIHKIIAELGIHVISQAGIEADDIIGSLAVLAKQLNYKVLIATGDKDFAQLVNQDIILINTMTNEKLDIDGVVNKFGVQPSQIVDYLTLIGDKSDNIPGVNKCGPKTASSWLNQYSSLDNIIANEDKLKGVVAENLKAAKGWLDTAKTLVTIDTKLDLTHLIPDGIESLKLKAPNVAALKQYYMQLGFKTWLKELESNSLNNHTTCEIITAITSPLIQATKTNRVYIKNTNEFEHLINQLIQDQQLIAITIIPDIAYEQTTIHYLLVSNLTTTYIIANEVKRKIDLLADSTNQTDYNLQIKQLLSSKLNKICYNYKDTLHLLSQNNYSIANVVADINIAHYLLNSRTPQSMSKIYKAYLDLDIIDIPLRLCEFTKNSLWQNSQLLVENLCLINENLINLEQYLAKQLSQDELKLYYEVELPVAYILNKMEVAGIKLDITQFKLLADLMSKRIKELEDIIYATTNNVFNISSNKQLQQVLFEQMGLPTQNIAKNTTGYSTDEESLTILADKGYTIANSILEYRNLNKLLNTYVNKLPTLVDKQQKVHTNYQQTLVTSGRLSSKDPNLQNIPIKSGYASKLRMGFIAEPNHLLIMADYSQIELRILAHLSKDEELIKAFNNNQDIHLITASEIFNKPLINVTNDERRYAKTINFSILYGKTVFGLAKELRIEREVAKQYIQAYFAKYPQVLYFLEEIKENARVNGYVNTILGRKIYLPNLTNKNRIIREAEERLATNAPMQGSSADIIKLAMINIHNWLSDRQLKTKIILQIHDELILETPLEEVELIKANLANLMCTNIVPLLVKLDIGIKSAMTWAG